MTVEAVKNFDWWHDAVFGAKPTRDAIPSEVLEAYLRVVRAEAYDHRTRVTIGRPASIPPNPVLSFTT